MGFLDWFQRKPTCPVSPATQDWIDTRWRWLEEQFGTEGARRCPVVLPSPQYFPDPYRPCEDDARRLLDRVCHYMRIDPARIRMSLYEEQKPLAFGDGLTSTDGTAGLYQEEEEYFRIWIEVQNLADPLSLVATMAHELGHVHLLGHKRISIEAEDHEPLTDLLTVFFGVGVITANSVLQERNWNDGNRFGWSMGRRGYLDMPSFGYALAKFAMLRADSGKGWSRELRLDVRSSFNQALRLLRSQAENGKSFS
jgi:hypothetical protein